MRLTFVQYGGDYREAWERFASGGKATYQAQRYSVAFVESLAQRLDQVTVICAMSAEPYDAVLPNKVRAIGLGFSAGFQPRAIIPTLSSTSPDRLCLTTPMVPLLRWAKGNRVRTLAMIADSFNAKRLTTRLRYRQLAYYLNNQNVDWVANHGISACLSLVDIGVHSEKIIPWDWPPSHRPTEYQIRELQTSKPLALAYVGAVTESKGVGDLLQSVRRLVRKGIELTLSIYGNDPGERMHQLASVLGLTANVHFAGIIPNEDIPAAMREADVIVIPSRHDYPEGLPLTIYEALATRTPIVASDHPMFRGALVHEQSALIFRAGDADALSSAILRLSEESQLYCALSANSERAWRSLQIPVKWGDMLENWLSPTREAEDWLRNRQIFSGRYTEQINQRRED